MPSSLADAEVQGAVGALLHFDASVVIRAINPVVPTTGASLTVDLSRINMDRLREDVTKKVKRKASVIEDIRRIVWQKLAQMLARNPLRMTFLTRNASCENGVSRP